MTFSEWLRRRIFDPGERLMVAVYAVILAALVTFILVPSDLPAWRFYGTLIALATFLAINMTWLNDDDGPWSLSRGKPSFVVYLLVGAGLVLLINLLGLTGSPSLLPYLMFPLVGQAFVMLTARRATLYALALLVCWLAVIWSHGVPLHELPLDAVEVGMGMVFTGVIALVAVAYGEQTARANALLEELRAVNAQLEAAREREKALAVSEERVRLARDIHDGLGHHLTVLNVQLQAAAKLFERNPERAAAAITTCQEVAQAALGEVRQSVAAMRGSPLDSYSLEEALDKLVRDFDRHSPIEARFEQDGAALPLSPAAATTLYRAVQEGLTNAQKHSVAGQATVSLHFNPTEVLLDVWNDGVMNGAPDDSNGGGYGLAGLRERTDHLGGTFAAGPQPDGTFRLQLALPLERNGHDSRPVGG
jgi:signal transduction histidine kinase